MRSPCRDCPERNAECHINCEKYCAYRAERLAIYKDRKDNKEISNVLWQTKVRYADYNRKHRNAMSMKDK